MSLLTYYVRIILHCDINELSSNDPDSSADVEGIVEDVRNVYCSSESATAL